MGMDNVRKEIGLSILKAENEVEAVINAERDELLNEIRLMMLPGLLKRKLQSESTRLEQNN